METNGVHRFFNGVKKLVNAPNNQITLIKAVKYGIDLGVFYGLLKRNKHEKNDSLENVLAAAQPVICLARVGSLARLFRPFDMPDISNTNLLDKIVYKGLYGLSFVVPIFIAFFGGVAPFVRMLGKRNIVTLPDKVKNIDKKYSWLSLLIAVTWYVGLAYLEKREKPTMAIISFKNYNLQDAIRYAGDTLATFSGNSTKWKLACHSVRWFALIKLFHSIWCGPTKK